MNGIKVRVFVRYAFLALAGFLILVTALPLLNVDAGWIRVWDFPRPQIAATSFLVGLGLVFTGGARSLAGKMFLAVLMLAGVYQTVRIAPYTPLVARQVADAANSDTGRCLTVLSANVHRHNRDARPLLQLIGLRKPDVVLLLETDRWWESALHGLDKAYPLQTREIRDNTYGLMFFSRFGGKAEIRHLVTPEIPSVKARLQLRDGRNLTFYGLHPEPPSIAQSSEERDAELILVAKEVRDSGGPQIAAGDLNDVAWSHTTRLFKQISRMVDPRVGRGLYASFHADYPPIRWPLDHLFHTDDFTLTTLDILPDIGSDHFPVFTKLCLTPQAEQRNAAPGPAGQEDRTEAQKALPEDGSRP